MKPIDIACIATLTSTAHSMTIKAPPGIDFGAFEVCEWDFHFLPPGYEPEPEFVMPSIERSPRAEAMASTSRVVFTAAVLPDLDPDARYGTLEVSAGFSGERFERWRSCIDAKIAAAVTTGTVPSTYETGYEAYGFGTPWPSIAPAWARGIDRDRSWITHP